MIVVTGASGRLGRLIVEKLALRVGAERVGASLRDVGKADDLAARGVRVRRGDFADPTSLPHAFEGASQVLLVSSNAAAHGGDTLAQHRAAIDAARAAGARRIVYTSHMAASATSAFGPARAHAATEAMLAASGVAWTSLRNGFYAASGVAMLGEARKTGVLEAPDDGLVSWTAHVDLAEAAAAILAGEGRFDGPTPPLTAVSPHTLGDLAAIVGDVSGAPIRRQSITEERQRAKMVGRGVPASYIDISLGFFRASRAGEFAAVSPALAELIGRAPTPLHDVVTAELA